MTYMMVTLVLVGSISNLIGKSEGLLVAHLAMGTFLFLARVYEPFVFMNIKQDIQDLFSCKIRAEKNQMYSEEPLCTFANSAMSIEFV